MGRSAFLLITGPSGAGKTVLVQEMLRRFPSAAKLVTVTSRPPRPGETDGADYHFVTHDEFIRRRDAGEFMEWAETYGQLYGSSSAELDRLLGIHSVVLAVIDLKGARAVRKIRPPAISVFIDVASIRELKRRLQTRPGITPYDLDRRVRAAIFERNAAVEFDRVIMNRDGHFNEAADRLMHIVRSFIKWTL